MKKAALVLVLVLVGGMLALGGAGRLATYALSPDTSDLEARARAFLEDLKFKDFQKSATYHAFVDRSKVNIPQLIEKTFAVKPEQLNIRDYKITKVDFDESGTRARTFFRTTCEILNTARGEGGNEERQIDGILYWHKLPSSADLAQVKDGVAAVSSAAGPEADKWFMKLESSLH